MLGLERLLAEEEPHLADGTTLSAHQVDALSGTLIALTSEIQESARNGEKLVEADPEPLPATDPEPELELDDDEDADLDDEDDEDEDEEPVEDDRVDEDEEPVDWDAAAEAEEEDEVAPPAEDPGADRRFWFEHATGAGKTVAAMGFVEASRTGGVLILTHRRNLVDQFEGELSGAATRTAAAPRCLAATATSPRRAAPSRSRPTSGSCATPGRSPTPTPWSSATRPTRRWARRPAPPSASGRARCSLA